MGKSSSLKKKRSKSHARKRGKSSSKRNKSKKIRRRGRSVSHSDDGDSRSSMSVSSSSSEEYYTSRRSRTVARKDIKGSKKRARRRSLSSENSEEAYRLRKRKGSKRSEDNRARKRVRQGKKKPRRDVSVSSTNSESWSCSTCQGSSSDERDFDRTRGRFERKEEDRKRSDKVQNNKEKNRNKSRSFSSCSRTSDSSGYQSKETEMNSTRRLRSATAIRQDDKASASNIQNGTGKSSRSRSYSPGSRRIDSSGYQSEEGVIKVNNTRKLRSVIIVVRQEEKASTSESGGLKEQIVYDHDGYQSNDTNGRGNRKDLTHHSQVLPENKRHADNGQGQNIATSDIGTSSNIKESCMSDGGNDKGNFGKGTEVSDPLGSLKGDDLESILRQRALENLRKFRGGKQTNVDVSATQKDNNDGALKTDVSANQKDKNEGALKTVYSSKDELFQISCKEDDSGAVSTVQEAEQIRQPKARKDARPSMPSNSWKTSDKDGIGQELSTPLREVSSLDWKAPVGDPKEKINAAVDAGPNETKLLTSSFGQRSRGMHTKSEHIPIPRESSQANLTTGSIENEGASRTAQTDVSDKVNKVPDSADMHSSFPVSTSGDNRPEKWENETKEGSQFEQKTMSVMRGGEMVQVNYKVYIPKKAPALARRQLKR